MIYRSLPEAEQTERHIVGEDWETIRLLLKGDSMGFSFSITTVYPNTEARLWYRHHLEAVFILEGEGEVECFENGKIYPFKPGTFYALDKHEQHILRVKTKMRAVCIFNPPLYGKETFDEKGAYPTQAEEIDA